jgi:hypothetical protein
VQADDIAKTRLMASTAVNRFSFKTVQSFERERRAFFLAGAFANRRVHWRAVERLVVEILEENGQVHRFFTQKLEVERTYAKSLLKLKDLSPGALSGKRGTGSEVDGPLSVVDELCEAQVGCGCCCWWCCCC